MLSCHELFLKAAKENDVKVVKFFIDNSDLLHSEFVNAVDNNGRPALFYAVRYRHGELLDALLTASDINVNIVIDRKLSPLLTALCRGHYEIVDKLLAVSNIDINARSFSGSTALHMAANRGDLNLVKKLLSFSDIDVTIKNSDSMTALDVASEDARPLILSFIESLNDVGCFN